MISEEKIKTIMINLESIIKDAEQTGDMITLNKTIILNNFIKYILEIDTVDADYYKQFENQELADRIKKSMQDVYNYMLPEQYSFAVTRQSVIDNWNVKKENK